MQGVELHRLFEGEEALAGCISPPVVTARQVTPTSAAALPLEKNCGAREPILAGFPRLRSGGIVTSDFGTEELNEKDNRDGICNSSRIGRSHTRSAGDRQRYRGS